MKNGPYSGPFGELTPTSNFAMDYLEYNGAVVIFQQSFRLRNVPMP